MKKIVVIFLSTALIFSAAQAFNDVDTKTKFGEKIEYLLENNLLQTGNFLKPNEAVPQILFWETFLRLEKNENISTEQIENLARRNGTPSNKLFETVEKKEALNVFLQYAGEYNLPESAKTETAFRNRILSAHHRKYFYKNTKLTRKEFFEWVYNFSTNEVQKKIQQEKILKEWEKSNEEKKTKTSTEVQKKQESLQQIYNDIIRLASKNEDFSDEKKWAIRNAAIEAMFNEIGDEFGIFFAPKESKVYHESLNSDFIGVGIYIKPQTNGLLLEKFLPNSPAKNAGLKVGDIITAVDGFSYTSIEESTTFTSKIRGPIGSRVVLSINRNGILKDFEILRAEIKIPTVNLDIKNNIPVISIGNFSNKVTNEFLELLNQNKDLFAKGIVIDLRGNRGGYLDSAAKLSSIFAKKNELMFVSTKHEKTTQYVADENGPLSNLKNIIILQNKATASAAEVLASFLQKSGRAKLYGVTSYGKGSIQEIKNYPNGASIKVTIGEWRPMDGISINKKGLEPDVRFAGRTTYQIENNIDPVLNGAIQSIKNNQ